MQSKKVAITGGIGSGKSSVCDIIKGQGYEVFSCDEIYKEVLQNKEFVKTIAEAFPDALTRSGELDRAKLSRIVFNDGEELSVLNGLTHSAIMSAAIERMEDKELSFCEVPLLFEGNFQNLFDEVIVVLREREQRILSVQKRCNLTREDVILRINSQFDYENCNFAKYYAIHNDGNFADLQRKTLEVLQSLNNKTI